MRPGDSIAVVCGTPDCSGALLPVPSLRTATCHTKVCNILLPNWTYRSPRPAWHYWGLWSWGFQGRCSRECRTWRRCRKVSRCGWPVRGLQFWLFLDLAKRLYFRALYRGALSSPASGPAVQSPAPSAFSSAPHRKGSYFCGDRGRGWSLRGTPWTGRVNFWSHRPRKVWRRVGCWPGASIWFNSRCRAGRRRGRPPPSWMPLWPLVDFSWGLRRDTRWRSCPCRSSSLAWRTSENLCAWCWPAIGLPTRWRAAKSPWAAKCASCWSGVRARVVLVGVARWRRWDWSRSVWFVLFFFAGSSAQWGRDRGLLVVLRGGRSRRWCARRPRWPAGSEIFRCP